MYHDTLPWYKKSPPSDLGVQHGPVVVEVGDHVRVHRKLLGFVLLAEFVEHDGRDKLEEQARHESLQYMGATTTTDQAAKKGECVERWQVRSSTRQVRKK